MEDKLIREYSPEVYLAKFGMNNCSRCNSLRVKCYERTKGKNEYTVYVCDNCKIVLGREMK